VVGHKEGLDVMERADPLFLLIGLPTIPVMLILGKMIRWEDYVLRLWRKYSNKLQILNSIFPGWSTFFSPSELFCRVICSSFCSRARLQTCPEALEPRTQAGSFVRMKVRPQEVRISQASAS